MAVDEQGVFSIDAGTGCFGVVPCGGCCKVFSPPWKRSALLGADFVDVALLTVVEVDANAVFFSALQYITSVEGGPRVPLEPIGNGQFSMSSQTFCIILRQVNDAAGLIATSKPALKNSLNEIGYPCLLYTSPSPRDRTRSRMPSSA